MKDNKIVQLILLMLCLVLTGMYGQKELPEWTRGAVWYQILPERFRNINPFNDPVRDGIVDRQVNDWQAHPWASDWYKPQVWEQERSANFSQLLADRRYGGDLVGVIEKLPYLKGLGVNVICLMPIFDSPSVEKYDATTFHHVDNNFGFDRKKDLEKIKTEHEDTSKWTMTNADEVFLDLINQAHELDLKIVIEAAFSFCSDQFWAFRDVKENQENSKYKDWFEILAWDDPLTPDTVEFSYKYWRDHKDRPLFTVIDNVDLPETLKQYIFESSRKWMDLNSDGDPIDGVDGWSISYVSDLPAGFWREWNAVVKQKNAEVLTIGDPQELAGFDFDMRLDSRLPGLIKDFFVPGGDEISVSDFASTLEEFAKNISDEDRDRRINQMSDHRSFRIASLIVNGQHAHTNGKSADNGFYKYNPVKPDSTQQKIQKLITLFHLTFPGSPMIYYGEESGMWGGQYPDNIKPMLWQEFIYEKETYESIRPDITSKHENRFDIDFFNLYRKINVLRPEHEALIKGDFKTHIADNERKLFVYSRKHRENEVFVFMNLGEKDQHVEYRPTGWKKNLKLLDPFSSKKYRLDKYEIKLDLPPKSFRMLVKEK